MREDTGIITTAQILHAFRWNAAGRIAAQIASWLITIFVMRLLTPVDYGLMGMAMILIGFSQFVNDLGAIPALIQRREVAGELVRKIFGFVLVSTAAIYGLLYVGAPLLADFFGEPRLVLMVRVLALGLVVESFSSVPRALLRREMKFKAISLIDFITTVASSVTTLILALAGYGVWSLVAGFLANLVFGTVGVNVACRFRMMPRFDFSGLGPVLSFGMKVSGAGLIYFFNSNFDAALIGRVLGKHALGLYSVANNLALIPASKVMQLTNQVAFSAYSRIQDDSARVLKYFVESVRIASFIFFPVCWGMSAVSSDFVDVLLGAKWHASAIVLQILALGIPYRALSLMMTPLVTGMGAPGISVKNNLTIAAILPAALAAGIEWGLVGLCVAALIGMLAATTVNLRRNLMFLKAGYGEVVAVCLPAMAAAGAMYLAIMAAHATVSAQLPATIRLPLDIGLGAVVYVLITLAINRQAVLRSLQVIRGTV